ncbi:hypothetical protein PIB30_046673 [Stylosanthes scabra]|uniref:Uncharacterized protein n=1 Tax=Stylosanthes scabra TaxID=79078 RepID=A0ABU6SGI1_9FABA|nr:hypothetical protein [Stylosanthes scabra]
MATAASSISSYARRLLLLLLPLTLSTWWCSVVACASPPSASSPLLYSAISSGSSLSFGYIFTLHLYALTRLRAIGRKYGLWNCLSYLETRRLQAFSVLHSFEFWVFSVEGKETLAVTLPPPTTVPLP